jgi:hypothetical protein
MRSNRLMLMLVVYIDDSHMNQPPVSVLGGWLADSKTWAGFSEDWQAALEMRPRLEYFKYAEAMGAYGAFDGWSDQSRIERVRLLMATLVRYKPLGVAAAMPHDLYQEVFGSNSDKVIRYPYFFCFYSVVTHVSLYLASIGRIEQCDFVFDTQPGQMDAVISSWNRLLEVAPPEVRPILGDYPIFRNDKTTLPLQASDLCAGYQRESAANEMLGREHREPLWGSMPAELKCIGHFWSRDKLTELMKTLEARRAAAKTLPASEGKPS